MRVSETFRGNCPRNGAKISSILVKLEPIQSHSSSRCSATHTAKVRHPTASLPLHALFYFATSSCSLSTPKGSHHGQQPPFLDVCLFVMPRLCIFLLVKCRKDRADYARRQRDCSRLGNRRQRTRPIRGQDRGVAAVYVAVAVKVTHYEQTSPFPRLARSAKPKPSSNLNNRIKNAAESRMPPNQECRRIKNAAVTELQMPAHRMKYTEFAGWAFALQEAVGVNTTKKTKLFASHQNSWVN